MPWISQPFLILWIRFNLDCSSDLKRCLSWLRNPCGTTFLVSFDLVVAWQKIFYVGDVSNRKVSSLDDLQANSKKKIINVQERWNVRTSLSSHSTVPLFFCFFCDTVVLLVLMLFQSTYPAIWSCIITLLWLNFVWMG